MNTERMELLATAITRVATKGALELLNGHHGGYCYETKLDAFDEATALLGLVDLQKMTWRGHALLQAALASRQGKPYRLSHEQLFLCGFSPAKTNNHKAA